MLRSETFEVRKLAHHLFVETSSLGSGLLERCTQRLHLPILHLQAMFQLQRTLSQILHTT